MMPMMPNTRVSPLAARKISRPYCRPLSTWMRTSSMRAARRVSPKWKRGPRSPLRYEAGSGREAATGARIGEVGGRGLDEHVLSVLEFAQIEILDRVVGGR